jgi:hypothetical protein
MTVERLVQELHIERTDIFVATEGAENSAGEQLAGSDTEAGVPTSESRDDAALEGEILVSIDTQDESRFGDIKAALWSSTDLRAGQAK